MSLTGTERVWILTGAFALIGLALYFLVITGLPTRDAPFHISWWVLAPSFALAEIAVTHLQFKREAVTSSLIEIPIILGLFFSSPTELMLGVLIGAWFAFHLVRKQPLVKLSFNLAKYMVETSLGIIVFAAVAGGASPMDAFGWMATFASTLSANVFSGFSVFLAIAMTQGRRDGLRTVMGFGTVASLANTCIALMAATLLWADLRAGWLLIFPAALLSIAYRAYTNQRERHEGLERLFDSAKVLQRSPDTEQVIVAMLSQAREMLVADYAEFVRFPVGESRALFASLGPGDDVSNLHEIGMDPAEALWTRAAESAEPILLPRPIKSERLRAHFEERGIYDAMAVPLLGKEGKEVVGHLLVGNHLGDVNTFDSSDLRLLETLANHASVALEKGELIDSLATQAQQNEFQAQHDALTGLYNRALFHERVRDTIKDSPPEDMSAVLLMDLDRFKEINDTLGHHIGDGLLIEMAKRLSASIPEGATVARLGGDEFAILLPHISAIGDATKAADDLVAALETPFELEQLMLDVGASIGIALYPRHGLDADALMQRADVAMYLAKDNHRGYEIYASDKDQYSPSRLALVGELRAAIEGRELAVWYQPKIDLSDGSVLGAEALVRWNHPRNGMMPPDEFISLAEHTGLIGPLTELVLDKSLEQCRHWRSSGWGDFVVAVNLSVRNLMDAGLPAQVLDLLAKWNLPPSALQLEITESTIMADPIRAITTLTALKRMGISLSIDDFGTGYSSLSYLKRLPVAEVKIDRSFVMGMATDENDAVIVRSVIDLARNLGLEVVAEGIESAESWNYLSSLGCRVGQGYYISKPLPSDEFDEWLTGATHADAENRPRRAEGVVPLVPRRRASGWVN